MKSPNVIPKLSVESLRKSPGRKSPISPNKINYSQSAGKLLSYLIMQLNFMDTVEDQYVGSPRHCYNSNAISFLAGIIKKIKDIDGTFVQSKILESDEKFKKILDELIGNKEIEIKNELIFSKSGNPKKGLDIDPGDRRRISFISTKFYDGDRLIKVTDLKEMSDLDFFMFLNGYHLPFYKNSTPQRSMYEKFFNEFLNKLLGKLDLENNDLSCGEYGYIVLQECIFQIQMITEYWISVIQCVTEIMSIIHNQIKMMDTGAEISFDFLKETFDAEGKIFKNFNSKKLLKSIAERTSCEGILVDDKYSTRIKKYSEALNEAIELYLMNSSIFLVKLGQMKEVGKKYCESPREWEQERYSKIISFMNDVIVYIDQFDKFLRDVNDKEGLYEVASRSGLEFLQDLEMNSKPVTPPKKGMFSKINSYARYYMGKEEK